MRETRSRRRQTRRRRQPARPGAALRQALIAAPVQLLLLNGSSGPNQEDRFDTPPPQPPTPRPPPLPSPSLSSSLGVFVPIFITHPFNSPPPPVSRLLASTAAEARSGDAGPAAPGRVAAQNHGDAVKPLPCRVRVCPRVIARVITRAYALGKAWGACGRARVRMRSETRVRTAVNRTGERVRDCNF